MKHFLFLLLVCCQGLYAQIGDREYSIVFVHVGKTLPDYLETAVEQAHLFNPDAECILIASKQAIRAKQFAFDYLECVACEDLQISQEHKQFSLRFRQYPKHKYWLWYCSMERLFYLDDLIAEYNLRNVFHQENDVLLYVDLKDLLPVFVENYKGIGAIFENDHKAIASLIYVRDQESIHHLSQFLLRHATSKKYEMYLIADFKKAMPDAIDSLPDLIDPEFLSGPVKTDNPLFFCNHLEKFNSLFDAASYGQYLGGRDPHYHKDHGKPHINPECIFSCEFLKFEWEKDSLGRSIPTVSHKDKKYRLNNLHIHSKNLKAFASNARNDS